MIDIDIEDYIESGILERFALDLLVAEEHAKVERLLDVHLELGAELEKIYIALEALATFMAARPKATLRSKMIAALANRAKEDNMSLGDLPLIDQFSDYRAWLEWIDNTLVQSKNGKETALITTIRSDDTVTQQLIVASGMVFLEIDHHSRDSLLVLNGKCSCNIDECEHVFSVGEFIEMPAKRSAQLELKSEGVIAVLQRLRC